MQRRSFENLWIRHRELGLRVGLVTLAPPPRSSPLSLQRETALETAQPLVGTASEKSAPKSRCLLAPLPPTAGHLVREAHPIRRCVVRRCAVPHLARAFARLPYGQDALTRHQQTAGVPVHPFELSRSCDGRSRASEPRDGCRRTRPVSPRFPSFGFQRCFLRQFCFRLSAFAGEERCGFFFAADPFLAWDGETLTLEGKRGGFPLLLALRRERDASARERPALAR